ncbi:MAG: penicillin-insensitive murein endopeptidase [Deltaproteobacteria bacterium]|nr:penicillin-insensitive murein endopeptidase [Deltaproteobacteria bacterium]
MFAVRALIATISLSFVVSTAQARSLSASGPSPEQVAAAKVTSLRKEKQMSKGRRARLKRQAKRRRWRRRRGSGFNQLKTGPGIRIKNARRSWGTPLTVTALERLGKLYAQAFPGSQPITVHDISLQRGGKMAPHLSHRDGVDVDIRLKLRRHTPHYIPASPRTLDLERTWFQIRHLVDSCDVEVVFLDRRLQRAVYQYALSRGVSKEELAMIFQYAGGGGIVRHWDGHKDHLHVRFRRSNRNFAIVAAGNYCAAKQADEKLLTIAMARPWGGWPAP